jgi:hypothetical protein
LSFVTTAGTLRPADGRHSARLRVLLIILEFNTWKRARHVSYGAQLGLEEGLRANGVAGLTLTTPWLGRARELCAGQHFDQVWIDIVQSDRGDALFGNSTFLEWIAQLAPVRVGFLPESLEHTPEEQAVLPILRYRPRNVKDRLQYLTHVVACDERDVDRLNGLGQLPALWWPQAIPARSICEASLPAPRPYGVFGGYVYGDRARWLKRPELKGTLVHLPPPEAATPYPLQFDLLHLALNLSSLRRRILGPETLQRYLDRLRQLRRQMFAQWLAGLQTGCAVVNLPHFVKTYAGRVVEGMAAGRPVISWDIPDRPRNRGLFEHGREILLFSKENPLELAEHIRRLQYEPVFARQLVEKAQRKVKQLHTLEKRVQHILRWLETGDEPDYGDAALDHRARAPLSVPPTL